MAEIRDLVKRLKALTPERMERLTLLAVKLNENVLIDYNTNQLMRGLDSKDKAIDPIYASASYAELKLHLNPRGVVDLKLTGNFHQSIFIVANDFPILFKANDHKAPELLEKYGADILGVPYKDLREFARHYVLADLQNQVRGFLQIR